MGLIRLFTLISILLLGFLPCTAAGSSESLDLDFKLPAPEDGAHLDYLGLEKGQAFTPYQISADILVIEIFSMYCPICQREAPKVNELYERLEKIQGKTIRIIGIGAGNSEYETRFFGKNYGIEFPLFSDGKFHIHKKIGEKGTPFFIGITPSAPEGSRIFFTHSGEIKDLDAFVDRLMDASR